MKRIVELMRHDGAKEIHLRISCPPLMHPCHYGIDMHSYEELLSAQMNPEQLAEYFKADSVHFLSIEGMLSAIAHDLNTEDCGRCLGCFCGKYPTPTQL